MKKNKEEIINLLDSINYILPCDTCISHYIDNIAKHPLTYDDLSSKNNLIAWFISFHNKVNAALNKKIIHPQEAIKEINKYQTKYNSLFIDVLKHIPYDQKINQQIIKFIKCGIHFSDKKNIQVNFSDQHSYLAFISKMVALTP